MLLTQTDPAFMAVASGRTPRIKWDFTVLDASTYPSELTYTRTGNATRVNSSGVIELVSEDVPRFDHDPVTLANKGLLVEEQRTNLCPYSESDWSTTSGTPTVTDNSTTSPDGNTTADTVTPIASSGVQGVTQTVTTTAAAHTISFFVKANGYSYVQIATNSALNSTDYANFNVTTGELGSTSGIASTIEAFPDGWYRITATLTTIAASGNSILLVVPASNSARAAAITGDGSSGVYVWGAQVEAGSNATSYIPTAGATATRNADSHVCSGSNFSAWWIDTEGTIVVEGSRPYAIADASSTAPRYFYIYNTSTTQIHECYDLVSSANNIVRSQILATTPHTTTTGSAVAAGATTRVSYRYKTDDFGASLNGATVVTDTSGDVPSPNTLVIGNHSDGTKSLNGTISEFAYYRRPLTDTQLQTLSA